MDPKPQMPDIKAEVNKIDDGKKKSAGLMGLLGGGGGGTAGGLGGLGAGAAGGGGLLATKAGILALVLMGSAVAGGIGLAGYKMFGPGEADKTGGNLSLFAPRTQPAADPNAVAPVNADGSSASLNFASAAAAKDKAEADAAAAAAAASASAEAPKDNTAEDPAKAAAAADAARREADARASAAKGSMGGTGGSGAAGTMNLAGTKKLGALSSNIGSGGGSTSASASAKLGDSLANAAKNGASSAFSRQGGSGAKASNARGAVGGRATSARKALRAVGVDQQFGKAQSSFAAGKTYDGSTAGGGGAVGPDGGAIGMGGVGDGAGAQPKALPANSKGSTKEQDPPVPEPPAKDVTPWAKEIMIGMALGAIAIAVLWYASSIIKAAKATYLAAMKLALAIPEPVEKAAAILAANIAAEEELSMARMLIWAGRAAALGGLIMGGMIAGGKNGQVLQGGLLIASSAMIGTIAMTMMPGPIAEEATTGTGRQLLADEQKKAFATPGPWTMAIGGVAAVGLVGAMMSPKKTCKSTEDSCHGSIQQEYKSPAVKYLV